MSQTLTYCGELIRKHDPDRFLLSLFAHAKLRPGLWALFAFNYEIAKTREIVTETQLGLIRLQWWREQIGQIYDTGSASENEVLKPLAIAIQNHNLPREEFENMIYAREFELEDVLPGNMSGTLKYIEAINLPLLKLAAKITGATEDVHQLALNFGLMRLIYAIPFHASQERCYLPEDLIKAENINIWSFYKGKNQEEIINIIQKLKDNFLEIRLDKKFLKSHQILARLYKQNLEKHQNKIFTIDPKNPIKFKELRLYFGTLF